jgi:hypothetical protein
MTPPVHAPPLHCPSPRAAAMMTRSRALTRRRPCCSSPRSRSHGLPCRGSRRQRRTENQRKASGVWCLAADPGDSRGRRTEEREMESNQEERHVLDGLHLAALLEVGKPRSSAQHSSLPCSLASVVRQSWVLTSQAVISAYRCNSSVASC